MSGRIGVTLPCDSSTLAFIFRYNKNDIGLPVKGVFSGPQPINPIINRERQQQQTETTIFSLEGKTRPVEWWESRGRALPLREQPGFQDPVDPGFDFDFPTFSQVNVERREAEWVNSFYIGKWSTSSVGLEYRHEDGENKGTLPRGHRDPVGVLRAAAPLLRPAVHDRRLPGGGQQRLRHQPPPSAARSPS